MTHGIMEIAELRVMSDDGLSSKSVTYNNINTSTYIASALPLATLGAGIRAFVTDATATTFASIVAGGGSNKVPVYSDGTDWRIG